MNEPAALAPDPDRGFDPTLHDVEFTDLGIEVSADRAGPFVCCGGPWLDDSPVM